MCRNPASLLCCQRPNLPADVTFILSHPEVPLHVVPGVSQLSCGEVADLAHEGLGSWSKIKHGDSILRLKEERGTLNKT